MENNVIDFFKKALEKKRYEIAERLVDILLCNSENRVEECYKKSQELLKKSGELSKLSKHYLKQYGNTYKEYI